MAGMSLDVELASCPVCGGEFDLWRSKRVGETLFRICECTACGYAFVNPRPSLGTLMEYYSAFGHGDGESPETPDDAREVAESIRKRDKANPNASPDPRIVLEALAALGVTRGRFLDVGCGFGRFSAEARRRGFEVVALEMADYEREVARELSGLTALAVPFEEYESDERFDVILLSQILEHAFDVEEWIAKARSLLKERGSVAIALPNFGSVFRKVMQEREPYICPPAHLNFFSAKSLIRLLERHGFEVTKVQWVSRLPLSAFTKRLPSAARWLAPACSLLANGLLAVIDRCRLGMIIRVYARATA